VTERAVPETGQQTKPMNEDPAASPAGAEQQAEGKGGGIDIATQRLARPAAVMAVGTLLSRVTGLGRVMAMAFALGVAESRLADSYNIASTLPNVVYELALGGVLTSVFIPVIVDQLRTQQKEDAWRAVSALVTVTLAILLALTLVTVAVAPLIIEGFSWRVGGVEGAQQHEVATFFLRLFAPMVLLFGVASIAGGLLNAHGRFAVPMFAPILNNLVIILAFLGFAALTHGVPTNESVNDDLTAKLILGLGLPCGVAAMAALNWFYVRKLPLRISLNFDWRHPAVIKLARLSAWTLVYVAVNAAGFAVSYILANQQQGGITAYFIAFTFFNLPYGIAAVSIMTALMPKLSAHFVDGQEDSFRARTAGGLRAMALLLLPATAGYLVLSKPIVEALLDWGVVTTDSVELVAATLDMFSIGLLFFAGFLLLMRAFYARQDSRSPALINIWANIVTTALDLALFPLMGVKGLALAHSLGYVVAFGTAWIVLSRRTGGLDTRKTTIEVGKAAIAAAAAGGAMLLVAWGLTDLAGTGRLMAVAQIVAAGAVGVVVFVLAARLLRAEELDVFKQLLPARFHRILGG
jgi:putative peptidoglycan lipid II flippase